MCSISGIKIFYDGCFNVDILVYNACEYFIFDANKDI